MLEELKAFLENELDDGDLKALWNEYCCETNRYDDYVYEIEEDLDYLFDGLTPEQIWNKIRYGNVDFNHTYLIYDGYANFQTAYELEDLIYISDLLEWLEDNINVAKSYGFIVDEDE